MKKNIYVYIFVLQALIIIVSSSCVNQKQIAYFQKGVNQSDTIQVAKAYIPRIQSGDILAISVGSLNPAASSFFNPYSAIPATTDNGTAGGSTAMAGANSASSLVQPAASGYLVDVNGAVDLPLLGTVSLGGLTTKDAKDLIKEKLLVYLKEPTVNVRFLNYKISVLGEVVHPAVYIIPNESITLPEALGLAGDLTIYGKRENVMVIRSSENGKKEFATVNLNNREVFKSPYYYLHANDVVYVEPSKGRIAQTDKTYQLLPIILSALSFVVIIFTYTTHK